MKEKFNWNFKTPNIFKELLRYEYKEVLQNDGKKELNKYIKYVYEIERRQAIDAIKNKTTQIKLDDVAYYVNDYGARGEWNIDPRENPLTIRVAFFGCSFTFGVGLDETQTYHNLVKKNWKVPYVDVYNLGYPGGSISKCVKFFKYLTNVCDIDIAIFLLPTHLRDEYVVRTREKFIQYTNLIPNFELTDQMDLWENYYKVMDEDNLFYDTVKHIDLIEQIAKNKKVKCYYSSWDQLTYNMVSETLNDPTKMLPYFKFMENMYPTEKHMGFARDGIHPGPLSQMVFADEIVEHLNNNYKRSKSLI